VIPQQPGAISGNQSACLNGTEIYSVPQVSGVTYTWALSTTGNTLTSNGNQCTINWTKAGSYTLSVTPSNNGCAGAAQSLSVMVTNLPAQLGAITGPQQTCVTSQTYSITPETGTSYTWQVSQNGGLVIANGNSATVNWLKSGLYTITVTPSTTCGNGPSQTLDVHVLPFQEQPVISQKDSVLLSNSTEGNQWYLDGTAIDGATHQRFIISTSGTYSVQVTNSSNCKSLLSEPFTFKPFAVTGVESPLAQSVIVYPNPAHTFIHIEIPAGIAGHETTLVTMQGKTVSQLTSESQGIFTIPVDHLPAGLYILTICTSKGWVIKKVQIR
jgi:hypothetical protein